METVRILVTIPNTTGPGSYVIPYTDWGSGTVDYSSPAGPPVYVRSRYGHEDVYLESPYLESPNLGECGGGGWLDGPYLETTFLEEEAVVSILLYPMYGPGGGLVGNGSESGVFRFGVKLYDRVGRSSGSDPSAAEETEVVINTWPRGASALAAGTIVAGVLTFGFTPSVDLR